ncbi:MAG: tetratricopeptide repeat protein [Trueperaceae bacterium]|nr:tetratricopeptide repeat protein [Trueperaceae bacterium]MCC6311393.1 tetratricopeptide repeat protein [Trueperaceae bacterium]MCW5820409.1 tetratricopeptide repeat protein [Trueperaceae bacterium]
MTRDETEDLRSGAATDDLETAAEPAAAETTQPTSDWRELLAQRRFTAARQAYFVTGEPEPRVKSALAALADVEDLVHERSFAKAIERIERLEVPAAIVPWDALVADLRVLEEAAKELDKRDPDAAAAVLARLDGSTWFPAERHTQLGTVGIYDSELAKAQAEFEAAISIDPRHYRALTNLGNVALEQGRVDEAIEHYQAALKLNEEFANAHHNLGVAYRRKGHLNKSVKSLRRAQRSQQRHDAAVARESLGKWTGKSGSKYLKWLLWGAAAIGVYFILKSAGYI